jgi:hypothetical protein
MMLQVKTKNNSIFLIDTVAMSWFQIDSPAVDLKFKILERGALIPQGFGIYSLNGRSPRNGFSSFGVFLVPHGTRITVYFKSNDEEVTEFTMPVPFNEIIYKILPRTSEEIQQEIENEIAKSKEPHSAEKSSQSGAIPATEATAEQSKT